MRIAILGGHGKIARQLHPLLRRAGHEPVALARREEYRADLEQLGAELRLLDLEAEDADGYAAAFAGCQAVVFAAGAGPDGNIDRKRTVDLEAALKSIEAAQKLGIERFVQISAISVDEPVPEDASPVWRAYVAAKRDSDVALRESGLAWTIIRPGRLTDDPAADRVALAPTLPRGDISRADVAAVVAACLADDSTVGQQWTLVEGDSSVAEAVRTAPRR